MLKGKLIESIRQEILRQQPDLDSNKKVHFLTVGVEIEKAYNTALKEFYYKDIAIENAEFDFYSKKFIQTVKTSNGVTYFEMPCKIIELKRNLGIRSVKPKSVISGQTGTLSFIRTTEKEMESIQDLEVFCCSKKAFFYMDGDRVVLRYPMNEYKLIESVEVKVLPAFSEFDYLDNIEFPMGEVNVTATILQLMGIRPVNNLNADDAQ